MLTEKSISNEPLVSIIIPVYNDKENYLTELIESIDKQSYKNFEVVIVDDASSNKEHLMRLLLLQKEKKSYSLQIFFQTENTGPAGALNTALEHISGVYVKYCSHDDKLPLDALKIFTKFMENNSEIDIVFGDNKVFGDVHDTWPGIYGYGTAVKKDLSDLTFVKSLTGQVFLGGPFCLIRRNVFTKIGNFDSSIGVEDGDFFLRAIDNNLCIRYLEELLYCQRKHSTSLSKNALYHLVSRYKGIRKYQERLEIRREVEYLYVEILEQLMSISKKDFLQVFLQINQELGFLFFAKMVLHYPKFLPSLIFRSIFSSDALVFVKIKKFLK